MCLCPLPGVISEAVKTGPAAAQQALPYKPTIATTAATPLITQVLYFFSLYFDSFCNCSLLVRTLLLFRLKSWENHSLPLPVNLQLQAQNMNSSNTVRLQASGLPLES